MTMEYDSEAAKDFVKQSEKAAFTSHGHHIPGTVLGSWRPEQTSRCGGPKYCRKCVDEVNEYWGNQDGSSDFASNILIDYEANAKQKLRQYIDSHYDTPPAYEIRVTWSCKTLQNWKGILVTDMNDQKMYEVIYDGDKKRTYIDEYHKFQNVSIPD